MFNWNSKVAFKSFAVLNNFLKTLWTMNLLGMFCMAGFKSCGLDYLYAVHSAIDAIVIFVYSLQWHCVIEVHSTALLYLIGSDLNRKRVRGRGAQLGVSPARLLLAPLTIQSLISPVPGHAWLDIVNNNKRPRMTRWLTPLSVCGSVPSTSSGRSTSVGKPWRASVSHKHCTDRFL